MEEKILNEVMALKHRQDTTEMLLAATVATISEKQRESILAMVDREDQVAAAKLKLMLEGYDTVTEKLLADELQCESRSDRAH